MGAISTYMAMRLDEITRKGSREVDRFGNRRTRTFSSDSSWCCFFFFFSEIIRMIICQRGGEMVKRKLEVWGDGRQYIYS